MKLVGDVGNWKIVAHIAFKFYSVASGTFSTGSTFRRSGAGLSAASVSSRWLGNSVNNWNDPHFLIAELTLRSGESVL